MHWSYYSVLQKILFQIESNWLEATIIHDMILFNPHEIGISDWTREYNAMAPSESKDSKYLSSKAKEEGKIIQKASRYFISQSNRK